MRPAAPEPDRHNGSGHHGAGLALTFGLVAVGVMAQLAAMTPSTTGSGRPGSISRGGPEIPGPDVPGRATRAHASFTSPAPHRALATGSSSAPSVRPTDVGRPAPSVVHADVPASGRSVTHQPDAEGGPSAAPAVERARRTGDMAADREEAPGRPTRPMGAGQVSMMSLPVPAAVPAQPPPVSAPAPSPIQPPAPGPGAIGQDETTGPPGSGMTPEPSSQGTQLVVVGPASVNENDVVEFAIVLQNAEGVAHVPLRLSFDPEVLEFIGAAEGDLLASDGGATRFQASEAGAPGLVDIALSRVRAGSIHGSGTLCTVTFRARAAGMSSIVTTGSRLLDGSSRALAFRRNDSHVAVE